MKAVFGKKSLLFFSIFILNSCTYEKLNEVKKNTVFSPSPVIDDSNVKIVATPSPIVSILPNANLVGIFDIKKASEVVTNKCTYCHSTTPNPASGRTKAAAGITFDSQSEIESQMDLIKKVTFTTRSMPIGSITITEDERNAIGLYGINEVVVPKKLEVKDAPSIITRKCTYCHSTTPDPDSGYKKAPEGFTLDSVDEMIAHSKDIYEETITKKSMPVGKITITSEERNIISQWISQQKGSTSVSDDNKDDSSSEVEDGKESEDEKKIENENENSLDD